MLAEAPPHYRLERLLGAGQTSRVFLAQHPRHGPLALKLLRDDVRSDPVLTRMFENEVQITLGLSHPNVIAAFEGLPTGPGAFLALEYCPGGTLNGLLKRGPALALERAYRLVLELGRGLEHCHDKRVLHRDVKPSNVFLTEGGSSKLGDFGTGIYLTRKDQDRVGTAFYMAPEIFKGDDASTRSDIYSLGIVAYELLAGERPFQGSSYDELMFAHGSRLPKNLVHLRPEVGREVAAVVARAMARDPDKRFASAQAFTRALAQATGMLLPELEDAPTPDEPQQAVGRSSRAAPVKAPAEKAPGLGRWFGRKRG